MGAANDALDDLGLEATSIRTLPDDHRLNEVPGAGREPAGAIGLRFRPAPDRRRPDIAGALWVDVESGALTAFHASTARRRSSGPPPTFPSPSGPRLQLRVARPGGIEVIGTFAAPAVTEGKAPGIASNGSEPPKIFRRQAPGMYP